MPAIRATSTAHVVSFPWTRAGRAVGEVGATRRLLADTKGVGFAVVGRSSAGDGTRNVNRSLSPRRFVVIVEWLDAEVAIDGCSLVEERWRRRGATVWSATLIPVRSSGTWRGTSAFAPEAQRDGAAADGSGLVASVTYARIRPAKMAAFYLSGFPRAARRMTGGDSPMVAGIGFGDIPVRDACTFSVWPSTADLGRIVHGRSEPHGIVSRRSTEEKWLTESLFARFIVVEHSGTWAGTDPLA